MNKEDVICLIITILVISYVAAGSVFREQEHEINCLELNLGKETCDKIFNNKE